MYGEYIIQSPLMLIYANIIPLGIGASLPVSTSFLTISGYNEIVGTCRTDVNGTLYINQYTPALGINLITSLPYTTTLAVLAGVTLAFAIKVIAPYCQIGYTNGAIAQTVFQLSVYGKTI